MSLARLLLPAVRWSGETGFDLERPAIDRAIEAGVGGFIVFGGEAEAVRGLIREMRAASRHPLLVGSDLERGAGQQFRGRTSLPPAAAIASLQDLSVTERAGTITAREARALGVDWVFAPVADVDLEPANPVIGTRAFGSDPASVAEQVRAWIRGCRSGGALACAKHFPGHGRTAADSHVELPTVSAGRALLEQDLQPFRAAIEAGVDSVMTAHVSYPALDPSGAPATLSAPILQGLLRSTLGFRGIVVTDAMDMKGASGALGEREASVRAVEAGCDALLYTKDVPGVSSALESAVREGRLREARVREAIARLDLALSDHRERAPEVEKADVAGAFAMGIAVRSLVTCRGTPGLPGGAVRLVEIDDDLGGPFPAYPRTAFPAALRRMEVDLSGTGTPIVALYADIRAWKGRPGISPRATEQVRAALAADPDAPVVLFSHPRLAAQLPFVRHLLGAWGGEALMQEAAAAWLTRTTDVLPQPSSGFER